MVAFSFHASLILNSHNGIQIIHRCQKKTPDHSPILQSLINRTHQCSFCPHQPGQDAITTTLHTFQQNAQIISREIRYTDTDYLLILPFINLTLTVHRARLTRPLPVNPDDVQMCPGFGKRVFAHVVLTGDTRVSGCGMDGRTHTWSSLVGVK